MNILWICNAPPNEAQRLMGKNGINGAGWIESSSEDLSQLIDIELSITFCSNEISELVRFEGTNIDYYAIPRTTSSIKYDDKMEKHFKNLLGIINPDLIHIHGTELAHPLALLNSITDENVVVSIQGLTSYIHLHMLNGLPYNIWKFVTIRDIMKKSWLHMEQSSFKSRGIIEKKILENSHYAIGRTTWDNACVKQINPSIKCYKCNESLRNEFYENIWNFESCEKHTIFISQASGSLKGLHFLLKALPLVLERFPQTKVYIAGGNIIKTDTLRDKLKLSGYGKYIKKLISDNDLREVINFVGYQSEEDIINRYLNANVFVLASSIENSSNSLGEAMLLGVPCVASCVGGTQDVLHDKKEGFLYPVDEYYMLAHYICEIFENPLLAQKISADSRERANIQYSRSNNKTKLLEIYNEIIFN